jgi:hypothetical protein
MHGDRGFAVHAAAIIADAAAHIDGDIRVDAGRDRVAAFRVEDLPGGLVGAVRDVVKGVVEFAQSGPGKIDGLHGWTQLECMVLPEGARCEVDHGLVFPEIDF